MGGDDLVVTIKQRCHSFGSWFVGFTGGLALAHYQEIPKTTPLYSVSTHPKVFPLVKQIPNYQYLIGAKNAWVRLALHGLGCAWVYSYLECKFQRGHRRSIVDAGLAGAITGGAFGLRGIPGGHFGAGIGAAGLGAYAIVMHLLFRG